MRHQTTASATRAAAAATLIVTLGAFMPTDQATFLGLLATAIAFLGAIIAMRAMHSASRVEKRAEHDRLHDPLTGAANRTLFMQRLEAALEEESDTPIGLVVLDLDNFKLVNDQLEHRGGDLVLVEVAERLMGLAAGGSTVARLGGDEFAFLSPHSTTVEALIDRVMSTLQRAFEVNGRMIPVSGSIGAVHHQRSLEADASVTASSMLKDAEMAVVRAQQKGAGQYAIFEPEMRRDDAEEFALRADLAEALGASRLTAVFQPIVEFSTGRVLGVEALARWTDPQRGPVSPDVFIAAAERAGMASALGLQVLEQSARQFASWNLPSDTFLSVNVSPAQLTDRSLPQAINTVLHRYGISPQRLVVEVGESALTDSKVVVAALTALRSLGVKVAVDDFGTGYTTLRQMNSLPADVLKIDRKYVSGLTGSNNEHRLVGSIITMAKSLGLEVVAEGVETEAERSHLVVLGCSTGQGYLFSKPLDAADVPAFVASKLGVKV